MLFTKDYNKGKELMNALRKAETQEAEEAILDSLSEFRKSLKAKGDTYNKYFQLYADAKNRDNACIDFDECIWEREVPQMVADIKSFGFREFTLSSTWSGAIEVAWLLQKNGCKLVGLVEINGRDRDYLGTGEPEKKPAYKFEIE